MENSDFNSLSLYKTVQDRYGKKHKVFSVRFKDVQTITLFTSKYSIEYFPIYLLSPVLDDDGNLEKDKEGNYNYNNGFYDDLLEIIELALDGRETKKEISEWLDMNLAKEIVAEFLGMSQFKKKITGIEELIGEISSQVSSKTQA